MPEKDDSSVGRTTGELLFEDYLREMEYEFDFEKAFPGKQKRPDYTLPRQNGTFLFDVKDFEQKHMSGSFAAFDPYPPIREKIEKAREKFKEFKEYSCSLVLRNLGNPFVMLDDPNIVLGSMYGDSGFTFPVDTKSGSAAGPIERAFLGRGKIMRPHWREPQNTTISAILTLRYIGVGLKIMRTYVRSFPDANLEELLARIRKDRPAYDPEEKHLGVIVWENAYAANPLPRDLFTGAYDERWGTEGDTQTVVFTGKKLRELNQPREGNP